MRLFLWLFLLCGCCGADPIDDLVGRLEKTHGLWVNGLYPRLELPASASNEELLLRLDKQARVVSARDVMIENFGRYRALRVVTHDGPRILLFRHEGKTGWWSRFYAEED